MHLQGAHEVQSVCLGHLRFVTCSAFMSGAIPSDTGLQSSQAWLLTGGGDGTVRWGALTSTAVALEHGCMLLHCQGRCESVQVTSAWTAVILGAALGCH